MSQPASAPMPQATPEPTIADSNTLNPHTTEIPSYAPATTINPHATDIPYNATTPHVDPTIADPTTTSQTLARRLDAAEHLWVWKAGLRAILIVAAIIGSACFGWAFANRPQGPFADEMDDSWGLIWSFITFGVSAVWCSTCILALLFRRPNRPVHPGFAVGFDLLLFLGFIATAMFALLGAIVVMEFGTYGELGRWSSETYQQHPNGTWFYVEEDSSSYYYSPEPRDCSFYTDGWNEWTFNSCAEVDAHVNALWAMKPQRVRTELVGVVCQMLGLLLHLVLSIWACVDTHRRRRSKVSKDAERLATDIVMKMIQSGAVVPGQNQSISMQRPLLDHAQQQGWAPAPMMPQPVVLGPEKGASRFA